MPGEADAILVLDRLTKRYGGVRAIHDCSFSIARGSITGLIGPNGAGKTTVFNVVTGFSHVDAGVVWFDGSRVERLPPHRVFHRGLMRTFQISRQFTSMSVIENLMVVPSHQSGEMPWASWFWPGRVARQEREHYEKADRVLATVGLTAVAHEDAAFLSGGQKKLLEIARTLMADPKMVLLDEVGAGINPTLARELMSNVRRLNREQGVTFLLIEHDMDVIAEMCDKVIVMNQGRWLTEGTPSEVVSDPRVLEAYLGTTDSQR